MALRWKDGEGWGEWTWRDYADRASRVAGGLAALGVGRGDRVVLMMRNRPEFHVADLAALLLGATPISIYNSSAPEQVQYLAGHCHARIAIVEDDDYLARLTGVRDALPELADVVVLDGEPPDGCPRVRGPARGVTGRPGRRLDRRRSRRPGDGHLHVGDDRPAEGRDDRPLRTFAGRC